MLRYVIVFAVAAGVTYALTPLVRKFAVRIGTAAETTAGMTEQEMPEIASLIGRALRGRDDDGELDSVREAVATLCSKFTPYPES